MLSPLTPAPLDRTRLNEARAQDMIQSSTDVASLVMAKGRKPIGQRSVTPRGRRSCSRLRSRIEESKSPPPQIWDVGVDVAHL